MNLKKDLPGIIMFIVRFALKAKKMPISLTDSKHLRSFACRHGAKDTPGH